MQSQSSMDNVALLKTNRVYEHIQSFFMKFNAESTTGSEYERDIRLFFKTVRNKDIENLMINDIEIDLTDLIKYQKFLIETGKYKNNTITRLIASVQSLYNHLEAHKEYKPIVNTAIFGQVKRLPDDTESIGVMSSDEVKYLSELALDEQRNGVMKKALLLFALGTSIRKSAVRKVRYDHITPHESKKDVYVVSGTDLFDKGKNVSKEIHKNLYDMLIAIKGDKSDTDRIFDISDTGIDEMMHRLTERAQFDPRRNLSFHSIRKASVAWVDEYTGGDIVAITAQGNWSSPTVAYKSYIDKKRKVNLAGTAMFEDESDPEIFDKLTRDEMLVLLKSFGNGIGSQLRAKAKELLQGRE